MKNMKYDEAAFPYNLLEEIGISKDELPEDAEATLYYAMFGNDKNRRSAEITLMRYRDCLTLQEIADAYLLSPERINKIISVFIQKMQTENNLQLLKKGMHRFIREEKKKSFYFGKGEIEKTKETEVVTYENKYNDSVCNLDISERAKNPLFCNQTRINGILKVTTVGDIIALGSDGLMRVNRIGRKSFEEIADILVKNYGENPDNWHWKTYCKRKTENKNGEYYGEKEET